MIGVFVKKIGMTQVFDENGRHLPVTVVLVDKNYITGIEEKDGAKRLFVSGCPVKKVAKPQKKILEKSNVAEELKSTKAVMSEKEYQVGQALTAELFNQGEKVKILSRGKGKGFQGTVKRHGFSRGPKTHGSHNYRQPGSIGSTFPQRVVKGKKMSGHMGFRNTTLKNIEVLAVNPERQTLTLKGSIPGPNQSYAFILKND